jgi:hypothetical protein
MHITKNVCESLVATIVNMTEKTKDRPKARNDLINSQPMQPRVSTLAELNALTKVTNRRLDFIHSAILFDEYHVIMMPNMFSRRKLVAH